MQLTMVGTGYVGLVTGACLANTGNDVTCLDVDEEKIDRLNRGESPIYEPGLTEMIRRNAQAGRLVFTTDRDAALRDADAIFICVGTPPQADGSADLQYVLGAADHIAAAIDGLGASQKPKLVVVKSTVPVGTSHAVRDRIRQRTKAPFFIANNPEFLKEGAAISDFIKPDRVVCGVEDEEAGEMLREIYEPFVLQGNPIFVMDVRSSEMVKYASNAMLATQDQLRERDRESLRALRRGHPLRARGHVRRPAHRQPVPVPGSGLRRLVLPEGHAGRHRHGPVGRLRLQAQCGRQRGEQRPARSLLAQDHGSLRRELVRAARWLSGASPSSRRPTTSAKRRR